MVHKLELFATSQMQYLGFFVIILKGIPWESYNISNLNPEISIIELVETIKEVISKKLIYHLIDYPDSYPQYEPVRRSPDISEAQIQLGFESRINSILVYKSF